MRLRLTVVLSLFAAGLLTPAWAQTESEASRPHRMVVVGPSSPDSLRRGAGEEAPSPLPSAPLPRPAHVGALLNPSGLAPQCRAQCAATRYACLAQEGDGLECNTNWNRCVLGCGASSYRYSSTSPQVFTQGFAPR